MKGYEKARIIFEAMKAGIEQTCNTKCEYSFEGDKCTFTCSMKKRPRVSVSRYGLIRDLQDRDLMLLTNSQEVGAVKDHFGWDEDVREFDIFFVKTAGGDYVEVYGAHGTVPRLDKDVYEIKWF